MGITYYYKFKKRKIYENVILENSKVLKFPIILDKLNFTQAKIKEKEL